MKRETKYYAEFFDDDYNIIKSFSITAYNPKQAMNRAIDKFDLYFGLVRRVVIRPDDDIAIKAEWNSRLSQH